MEELIKITEEVYRLKFDSDGKKVHQYCIDKNACEEGVEALEEALVKHNDDLSVRKMIEEVGKDYFCWLICRLLADEDPPPEVLLLRAYLWQADLRAANLHKANLQRANLQGVDLMRADLREADIRGADLRWAYLWRADLRGADLRGADLRGADLRRADLWGADLTGADLTGANLRGVILDGTSLEGVDVTDALLDRDCRLRYTECIDKEKLY